MQVSKIKDRLQGGLDGMRGDGLRAKAMRGSGWVFVSFCTQQVLRLATNLILTRLLFPEAFGLMALAQVFMQGLKMLSDIGVGHSVVQNEKGGDPDFLSTAWTLQVFRGFMLSVVMALIAYPVSKFYDEPILFSVLIVIGLATFIQAFQSIGLAVANRSMVLGRVVAVDLISYVIGIVVIIIWALVDPTVWALVAGGVFAAISRVIISHSMLGSVSNRFRFNREYAGKIMHYGKWIFFSTAMTYIGGRGIMLVQGVFVPIETLGLISIAGALALMARQFTQKLGTTVFFPVFAEIHRDRPHEVLPKLKETRLKLFWCTLPIYVLLILFGVPLIGLMYDDRYAQAGGFLVILSVAGALSSMRIPFGMSLLAVGDSYGHAYVNFIAALVNITGVIIGYTLGGVNGMLIAGVVAQVVVYPIEAWRLQRHKLWLPVLDVLMGVLYLGLGVISYVITIH